MLRRGEKRLHGRDGGVHEPGEVGSARPPTRGPPSARTTRCCQSVRTGRARPRSSCWPVPTRLTTDFPSSVFAPFLIPVHDMPQTSCFPTGPANWPRSRPAGDHPASRWATWRSGATSRCARCRGGLRAGPGVGQFGGGVQCLLGTGVPSPGSVDFRKSSRRSLT